MAVTNATKKVGATRTVPHLLGCVSVTLLFTVTAHTSDLPTCSTEKVNNDCVVNIDRRYPITMPTFQKSISQMQSNNSGTGRGDAHLQFACDQGYVFCPARTPSSIWGHALAPERDA